MSDARAVQTAFTSIQAWMARQRENYGRDNRWNWINLYEGGFEHVGTNDDPAWWGGIHQVSIPDVRISVIAPTPNDAMLILAAILNRLGDDEPTSAAIDAAIDAAIP